MYYGFCSLFSLLLYGTNRFEGYSFVLILEDFFNCIGSWFYWFGGHIWGTEQFYNSVSSHPEYAYNFVEWANSTGLTGTLDKFFPSLLGLIASIIVVWGLVRLIVKVCSLGKITY